MQSELTQTTMQIIREIGNKALMERRKTLFLSSRHVPIDLYENIFGWVDSLTKDDCVVCFNSSELEEEVMKALLVNGVPTILVVMNGFSDMYNFQIQKARQEGRILILVLKRDEPRGAGQTVRLRNEYIISQVDDIVCGYINKNGSIFPLLAGRNNVRFLEDEEPDIVAEGLAPTHQRWMVYEDKTLLRMFYEDMGIHAIKKRLRRTYLSVRNRTKAITMPEDVLKGREFEDFVLELFDLKDSNAYSLIDWRSDKTIGGVSPVSNSYPDFVIEYRNDGKTRKFAIECKWRSTIYWNNRKPIIEREQLERYQEYAREKKQQVIIVLGVGGIPSMPEEFYIVPLNEFEKVASKPSLLHNYRRDVVSKWFSIDEIGNEEY